LLGQKLKLVEIHLNDAVQKAGQRSQRSKTMFPKCSRIKKKDVLSVIKEGASYHSPSFLLKTLKNPLKTTLFAVIISKKVAKTAVSRNKNKRRVREAIKKQFKKMPQGCFYIIMLKKDLNNSVFKEIEREISEIFGLCK
jgi:ribonuclease P protein component